MTRHTKMYERDERTMTTRGSTRPPTPYLDRTAMYGATKAFLSQFAACLAVEVKSRGAWVCRAHACMHACACAVFVCSVCVVARVDPIEGIHTPATHSPTFPPPNRHPTDRPTRDRRDVGAPVPCGLALLRQDAQDGDARHGAPAADLACVCTYRHAA